MFFEGSASGECFTDATTTTAAAGRFPLPYRPERKKVRLDRVSRILRGTKKGAELELASSRRLVVRDSE